MRILLADDHDLVRDTIAAFLAGGQGVVVDTVPNQPAVLRAVAAKTYDIILLDYEMPGMSGLAGLREVRDAAPGTPVALMTGTLCRRLSELAIEQGAAGFIPKTIPAQDLMAAIKAMISGLIYDRPDLLPEDIPTALPHDGAEDAMGLSRRERHVLRGICEGKSNKEIARDLELQEVTVKVYVKTLTRKMQAKNRTHAAMMARDMQMC